MKFVQVGYQWYESMTKTAYKIHRVHVITQPNNQDQAGIPKLLRKLGLLGSQLPPNIPVKYVLTPNDPRGTSGLFDEEITKEIVGLSNKKGFKVVVKEEVDDSDNIIRRSFVLEIRNKSKANEVFKACYVVPGTLRKRQEITSAFVNYYQSKSN